MSSRGKAFKTLLLMADEQEAAEGKAFGTLLSMADELEAAEGSTAGCSSGNGVVGRCQASLQLFVALAFLSVDAPVSLERQLAVPCASQRGHCRHRAARAALLG